jgi:hypothetical protein
MAPETRPVCRFAAEPPQEGLPFGAWAERLSEEFLAAVDDLDTTDVELGSLGDLVFHPDRHWNGLTYVPITAQTAGGYEVFGYVSFTPPYPDAGLPEPSNWDSDVDYTDETAERNPDWRIDLNEDVVGEWHGQQGDTAKMTLIWGRPLTGGGAAVTAELAGLVVDQCELVEYRFTLLAPDDYRGDTLEVALWDAGGGELARESLYAPEEEEEEEEEE